MALRIDGSKFDIRVICTEPGDSEDSGYVEGVPIDPPDKSPGWMLMDLWVEHDTQQEQVKGEDKGEKAKLVTRLVNPAFYQLWARKKVSKAKRRGRKPKTSAATAETPAPAAEQETPVEVRDAEVAVAMIAPKSAKPRITTPRTRKAKPKKRKKGGTKSTTAATQTPDPETGTAAPPADTTTAN